MTLVGPVSHVTFDLDTQRRIQDARRDGALEAALGRRRRGLIDRLLRRPAAPSGFDPGALRPPGEDIQHALRY
jgi:hypothetical protein